MCNIEWGRGTTVRVLRLSLCKINKFDFLEKKSCYLIVIHRTLNSTIKPGTRTAHLLNVNQNE